MTTTARGLTGISELAGKDLGHTEWTPVGPDRAASFAHATDAGTHDPTDEGPLGGPVADGFHTLGLVGTLFDRLLRLADIRMNLIYGVNRVRFPAPVPLGASVRLHATIAEVTELEGGGLSMLVDATLELAGETKPACVAQVVYRVYD
ncbi:MaoC/PaaZ C-terminal domain-containing protein [Amycolatopsis aidingensis]|uniref:MaoC/PaaZ C-terminal domain-containing protein n=1 Tax=Amycolatopsis aidingensis TaxID=2842453 RepID=UPI001C0D2164|nr:MaoC/PaaZ C-terminal domain-containing protein [Amycolatopsis aidingensis]